jgi:hypothetical protein
MFPAGIAVMAGLARHGPQAQEVQPKIVESGRPTQALALRSLGVEAQRPLTITEADKEGVSQ